MTEQILKKEKASNSVRHRALCEDDSYKGKWHKDINEAYKDGNRHQQKIGNEDHFIRIITEEVV